MTQQQDLTAEALQRGAIPGRGYALARRLSQILHPVPLSIGGLFIIGLFGVVPWSRGLGWAVLATLLQVVPPTAFFLVRLRQGAYSDEDVSVRTQRNELYFFGFATILVGALIMTWLNAPLPFVAALYSAAVVNIGAWLVNLFWKISAHAAAMGSCATVATIYAPPLGWMLWGAAILLGWARVRTRNHTPLQVIAGSTLAAVAVLAVFRYFGLV